MYSHVVRYYIIIIVVIINNISTRWHNNMKYIINAIACSLFAGCWWRPPDSRSRRGAGRVCPSDSPSTYRARAISCCRTRTPTCRPTTRPTWTLTSPPACGNSPWTAEQHRHHLHSRRHHRFLVDDYNIHAHRRNDVESYNTIYIYIHYVIVNFVFVVAHP